MDPVFLGMAFGTIIGFPVVMILLYAIGIFIIEPVWNALGVLFKPHFEVIGKGVRYFRRREKAWANRDLELWRKLKTRDFGTAEFSLEIVVEPDGQYRIRQLFRSRIRYVTVLVLLDYIPGEQNESMATEKSALSVSLGGHRIIGYLTHDDSERYRKAVELWKSAGYLIRCRARLIGRVRCKRIGIWLDLDTPEAMEAAYR